MEENPDEGYSLVFSINAEIIHLLEELRKIPIDLGIKKEMLNSIDGEYAKIKSLEKMKEEMAKVVLALKGEKMAHKSPLSLLDKEMRFQYLSLMIEKEEKEKLQEPVELDFLEITKLLEQRAAAEAAEAVEEASAEASAEVMAEDLRKWYAREDSKWDVEENKPTVLASSFCGLYGRCAQK